jgi:hypothetical protein
MICGYLGFAMAFWYTAGLHDHSSYIGMGNDA